MKKILIMGQTPPPFGGQAMMIERLVLAQFKNVKIYHVRMNFSSSFRQVGRVAVNKILQLVWIIMKVYYVRFRYRIHVLYFPPAGPSIVPIIRDIIILIIIRPIFRKVIFHFRAAGVSECIAQSNRFFRFIAGLAYNRPTLSIQLSSRNPPDGRYLNSERVEIVPNGLEDEYRGPYNRTHDMSHSPVKILFVGVLQRSKGIEDLIMAGLLLQQRNVNFEIHIVGEFISREYQEKIMKLLRHHILEHRCFFHGVKTGNSKRDTFEVADLFCFPTFFESESFGNVLLEAMMFELPVVATHWRGIPDIVDEGRTGYLVSVNQPVELAEKLQVLCMDARLRVTMGENGRKKFTENYRLECHLKKMESLFCDIAN